MKTLTIIFALAIAANATAADPTYWQDIRPVLRKHCTVCHSARKLKEPEVSGGLALDAPELIGQKVVIRGQSGGSLLIKMLLLKDEAKRMPLSAPALPNETIDLLRRWIDTGAKEGTKPAETTTASTAGSGARRGRKLDVMLPTQAQPPAGAFGSKASAKLELALPVGPLAPVTAVAFHPNGQQLATGSYGQAVIWDLASVKPIKVLTNVLGAVNDLRYTPDGQLLVVAGGQPSAKGDLRLFRTADWSLAASLGGHDDVVFGTALTPDGKLLASASFDKTVRIWDVASHKLLRSVTGHSDFVYAVAFDPKGQWFVSASKDRSVKKFDVATGKSLFTFSGMNEEVLAVTVSPDGKQVVSSGVESNLYWWDPVAGTRTRQTGGHGATVYELGYSKDGKFLLSGSRDGTIKLWNPATPTEVTRISVTAFPYAVALSSDNKRIAGGCVDGLVRLWEAPSGRHLLTLLTLPTTGSECDWLALTPEGYAAASAGLEKQGQWKMGETKVAGDAVWQTLRKPDVVAKAAQGPAPPAVTFGK
jgi:WD40 repeat protein